MKRKFLSLSNPCIENWENMRPNSDGNFCELCAKTVIDFTKLNQHEIAIKMKEARDGVCARITQEQLYLPLPDLRIHKQYDLPYTTMAASLMIASTLVATQPLQAKNQLEKIEFVQSSNSMSEGEIISPEPSNDDAISNDFVVFKGKIISEKNKKPIENAKITFVTIEKLIIAYTLADGTFSMEIPENLIDNDNVVRVSYIEIKMQNEEKHFFPYGTKDYILTKREITSNYQIAANGPNFTMLGLVGVESREVQDPVVINNGAEIQYKEFIKAQNGEKSSCSLENRDYLYFESKAAIAIYGEKAKYGLYILTEKYRK
jgi:hypothetical protein